MKLVGILGGMGPQATIYFQQLLINKIDAETDQDHIPTFVVNDPSIPDRTDAIIHEGRTSLPKLKENVKKLDRVGVDMIVMPCNSAHHYYDDLTKGLDTEFMNIIETTVLSLSSNDCDNVSVMCTQATLESKLYHNKLQNHGITVVDHDYYTKINELIYDIKAGHVDRAREALQNITGNLINRSDAVILGCTELSFTINPDSTIIDPLDLVADELVNRYSGCSS